MGDMGLLRRPPRGWVSSTVASVRHRSAEHDQHDPEGGETVFETSCQLEDPSKVCVLAGRRG